MKAVTNRGKNSVTFIFYTKNPDRKIDQFLSYTGNKLRYQITKNRPIKGAGYKPPMAVVIYFKIGYSYSTVNKYRKIQDIQLPEYFTIAFTSPPDMVINEENIKTFTVSKILSFNDDFENTVNPDNYEHLEQPENIREITIKFIHSKK